jgi:hypothetical protein
VLDRVAAALLKVLDAGDGARLSDDDIAVAALLDHQMAA